MSKNFEFMFKSPGPQPNGMQAVSDGLWLLDQRTNQIFKVSFNDGSILLTLETKSDRGSGITDTGSELWASSTYSREILKINKNNGTTIASYHTPGASQTGAHGLEWVDGKLWMAVPPSQTIYQIEPSDFSIIHIIPAPGSRPHGIAWDNGYLWCVESNHRIIYKLNPETGEAVDKIEVPQPYPEPHGLTIREGVLWYCDAGTAQIFTITHWR
jgi:streptogramin lyase